MNINQLYQRISISQIDMEDLTFCLAPIGLEGISTQLRNSVTMCGIIHPPILAAKDNGDFLIVTGRERIYAALKILDASYCNCLIIQPNTPQSILLNLALQDILLYRSTTPVEKAICWQKAVNILGADIAEETFGPQLELTRQLTPAKLEKIITLNDKMQKSLHQGTIELKTTLKYIDLPQADREALFETINQLHLSSSNQRKLVDQCLELSKRHNKQIATILSGPECLEIINHLEANPPQKATMLMNWLNGECHPRLTKAEREFRSFVGKLKLPKNLSLEHTASFEKDAIKLSINFQNQQQFTRIWPLIKASIINDK